MAKQVEWNKTILDKFITEAMLNEDEAYIMESRIKGATIVEQALHLNKSEACIHKMVAKLKKKYDNVQKLYPNDLPKRKTNLVELYKD